MTRIRGNTVKGKKKGYPTHTFVDATNLSKLRHKSSFYGMEKYFIVIVIRVIVP